MERGRARGLVVLSWLIPALTVGLLSGLTSSGPAFSAIPGPEVSVRVSASTVFVNHPVVATGRVSEIGNTSGEVTLEGQVRGGDWVTLSKETSLRANKFSLTIPTDTYGTRAYRVRVRFSDGQTSYARVPRVTVTPTYIPMGDPESYTPIYDPTVTRWDPCDGPITYRVNALDANSGAVSDVQSAFKTLHEATGLEFQFLGLTADIPEPTFVYQDSDADIVVAWPKDFHRFDNGHTLGSTVLYSSHGYSEADGRSVAKATHANVWLKVLDERWAKQAGTTNKLFLRKYAYQVIQHELGHALGLGHTLDAGAIMQPAIRELDVTPHYSMSDLAGLNRLGAAQGCLRENNTLQRYWEYLTRGIREAPTAIGIP